MSQVGQSEQLLFFAPFYQSTPSCLKETEQLLIFVLLLPSDQFIFQEIMSLCPIKRVVEQRRILCMEKKNFALDGGQLNGHGAQ